MSNHLFKPKLGLMVNPEFFGQGTYKNILLALDLELRDNIRYRREPLKGQYSYQ